MFKVGHDGIFFKKFCVRVAQTSVSDLADVQSFAKQNLDEDLMELDRLVQRITGLHDQVHRVQHRSLVVTRQMLEFKCSNRSAVNSLINWLRESGSKDRFRIRWGIFKVFLI